MRQVYCFHEVFAADLMSKVDLLLIWSAKVKVHWAHIVKIQQFFHNHIFATWPVKRMIGAATESQSLKKPFLANFYHLCIFHIEGFQLYGYVQENFSDIPYAL